MYIHPDQLPEEPEPTPDFAHFFGLPKQLKTPQDFLYIWDGEDDCDCDHVTDVRGH